MRIALAQINPVVGDLLGNADRIHAALAATEVNGKVSADLLVTPELLQLVKYLLEVLPP